jgi:hypothetical protein
MPPAVLMGDADMESERIVRFSIRLSAACFGAPKR